jgi:predicted ester cyclase
VLVTGVHTGTFLGIPPTGRRIEVDQALFARVERGRIGELWEIVDTGSGLRQLGVLGNQAIGLEEG